MLFGVGLVLCALRCWQSLCFLFTHEQLGGVNFYAVTTWILSGGWGIWKARSIHLSILPHLCFVSFLRSALAHTDDTTLHNWFPSPSLTTKIYHIWNVSRMQNRDGILRSDCDFDFLLPWKTRTWLLNPHLRHYMSTRGCCTEIVVIDFTNICRSFSCNVATANLTTFVTLPDEVNLAFWLNIFCFVSMCKSRYIHHETFCDNDFVIPCRCMSGQFCHKPAFASHNNQEGARRPTELVPAKCFTILHGSSFTCPSP